MITWKQYRAGMFAAGKFPLELNGSKVEVAYAPHFSGGCCISIDGDFSDVHPSVYAKVISHIGVQ